MRYMHTISVDSVLKAAEEDFDEDMDDEDEGDEFDDATGDDDEW